MAVISKMLMEGLLASARLYGEYMESYLWTEEEVQGRFSKSDFSVPGFFIYDVSNVISVWGWQLTYTALVPFIMIVEIVSAVKTSMIRFIIWNQLYVLENNVEKIYFRDLGGILIYRRKKGITDIKSFDENSDSKQGWTKTKY